MRWPESRFEWAAAIGGTILAAANVAFAVALLVLVLHSGSRPWYLGPRAMLGWFGLFVLVDVVFWCYVVPRLYPREDDDEPYRSPRH